MRAGSQSEPLPSKELVQEIIADAWIQTEQFHLLVLDTAWRIDRHNDYARLRADISPDKAAMPQVLHDIVAPLTG